MSKSPDSPVEIENTRSLASALGRWRPGSLPLMSRHTFRRELLSWSFLPIMLSGLQGGIMAVFVKKTFADLPGISVAELNFAVGLVAAAKAIGHLTSFLWASVSHGRPKIRFIVRLQLFTALTIALVAFAPRSAAGMWLVTGLCIAAWTMWSGVVTLQTGVWRANYHISHRARVAGRLATIHSLIIAAGGALIGFSLDWNSSSYRVLFPALGLAGIVGATLYARIRFRGHKQHLSAELSSSQDARRPSLSPLAIGRVLTHDRAFAGYMACMFCLGLGNLMLQAPLAIVLSDQFQVGYQTGIAVTTIIPLVCMTVVIPFWSRLLERMHVVQYRAIHGWTFVAATGLVCWGAAANNIWLVYLSAVAVGVGWGGGTLAWNLGHQHFAPRERDAEYMGVHVTLTGIRGFLGPMAAVQIYTWLAPSGWGFAVFAVCAFFNLLGAIGFLILSRKLKIKRTDRDSLAPEKPTPAPSRDELAVAGSK